MVDLNVKLETATSLILFCAADAVLDRYMEVVVAAFNVPIMLAILSQARRALHADPQDITRGINPSQSRVEPAWKIASLCFGPFIWAMPILFAPLRHLTDKTSTLVVYSTLYCDIPDSTYRDLSLVFLLLPLLTAVIISLWIVRCLVLLYQRHRNTVAFALYLPLGRRFTAMAAITLLATILLVINASTRFATKALVSIIVVWEALAPILQFLIFASQKELVVVWSNWIHFRFRLGTSGSSSYSTYSLRQFPNAVRPHESTVISVRASRSLPPLPSEARTSNSDSSGAARPQRGDSQIYQTIQLQLPGSRLSIPPQLRNRTPTPTPQILATATQASSRPESPEDLSLFTPTSASDPLFTGSSRRGVYDSPVLPPAIPAANGSQGFYSRSPAPQFYPQRPVSPSRHRSLPAQMGKRPLILASASMRGASVSPYEIPPPPARPPPAPSSTTSRSASFSSSSQWSEATARSSHSRSIFTRFSPNASRRSAPAPIRQPSMTEVKQLRELLSQFPPSPGSSAFPALSPPTTTVQDSPTVGPTLETIQVAAPAPVAPRPATIDRSVRMIRSPVAEVHRQTTSLPPLERPAEVTALAVSPGRSLTHGHPREAHTAGGTSGSPFGGLPPAVDIAQTLDVRRESAHQGPSSGRRSGSMSRSRPPSRRPSQSFAGGNGFPSDIPDVPPVPSRPTSITTPASPGPARTRSSRPVSLAPSERVVAANSPRSATRSIPPVPRLHNVASAPNSPASSALRIAPRTPRESLPPPIPPKGEYTRTWI